MLFLSCHDITDLIQNVINTFSENVQLVALTIIIMIVISSLAVEFNITNEAYY